MSSREAEQILKSPDKLYEAWTSQSEYNKAREGLKGGKKIDVDVWKFTQSKKIVVRVKILTLKYNKILKMDSKKCSEDRRYS